MSAKEFDPNRRIRISEMTLHATCVDCGLPLSQHEAEYVHCRRTVPECCKLGTCGAHGACTARDKPVQERLSAPDILKRAAKHMEDRAAARDQPGGERSMARTVAAFNAITGHTISERDGWMFMVMLKAARACTTAAGLPDDYEDLAAYAGLAGESV